MLIRAEQMQVFETAAEENFARRLSAHLLENYATAMVHLPDSEATVNELPAEKLHSLVEISIERARRHGLTYESSISAFSALMFEVSPNFDSHRLSQVLLNDETIEPDARLDELLEVLTEKNWETIRAEYDVYAWQPKPEEAATADNSEATEQPAEIKNIEFAETAMNVEKPEKSAPPIASPAPDFDLTVLNAETEKPKTPAEVKRFDLDETMMNFENPNKAGKDGKAENFDFPDTVLNIDLDKK